MAKAGTYAVGDVIQIRKGDKINIGIPEYCALQNSVSSDYVLTNKVITIGSIIKAEKRYARDTLVIGIAEVINNITGIAPTTENHLNKDIDKLISAVECIEKKLICSFDTSVFIGEWSITKIEPCNENGAICLVRISRKNRDGSVMNNFFRVYGNEKMNFAF